jgi:hypothetical protein
VVLAEVMPGRSERTHRVAVLLTEQEYQSLKRLVLSRKQADLSLPTRWGMSDLVREVLLDVLNGERKPQSGGSGQEG